MEVRRVRKSAAKSSRDISRGSWPVPVKRFAVLSGVSMKSHTPETAGVDKAQFSPRGQMQNAMRVGGNRGGRIGDQQPPGHAQMHDPLQSRTHPLSGRRPIFQIEDDVFAYPEDTVDAAPGQLFGHCLGRRLERLRFLAEPGGFDAVSAKALVDPSRDSFNFRQFRHGSSAFIVAESGRRLAATGRRYMIWSWTMLRRRASKVTNISAHPFADVRSTG